MTTKVIKYVRGLKADGYPDSNDYLHRKDGPALVIWHNDLLKKEEWHINNLLHRKDGPAIIQYDAGIVSMETWFDHGEEHRKGGPSNTSYFGGQPITEQWVFSGLFHNPAGPAKKYLTDPRENKYALYGTWLSEKDHARLMRLPLTKRLTELLTRIDKRATRTIEYMLRLLERHKPGLANSIRASILLQE